MSCVFVSVFVSVFLSVFVFGFKRDSDDIECKLCEVTFSVRVLLEKSSGSWWSLAASVLSSKTSCVFVTVFAFVFVCVFGFVFM